MPGYIGTYIGKRLSVKNPELENISLEDIAHAISLNSRFNGHVRFNWTVAQHSLLVADIIRNDPRLEGKQKELAVLAGLLHDASEAYMSDIARPYKKHLKDYLELESVVQSRIYEKFGISNGSLPDDTIRVLNNADDLALDIEAKVLVGKKARWENVSNGTEEQINNWVHRITVENPQVVKGTFILSVNKAVNNYSQHSKGKLIGLYDKIPITDRGEVIAYLDKTPDGESYDIYDKYNNYMDNLPLEVVDNSSSVQYLLDYLVWQSQITE